MKISKIGIKNFRLLKDFEIELEEDLSLVIGKNNTGKTSLLSVLDRLLGNSGKGFKYDDFNLDLRESLIAILEGNLPEEGEYLSLGINALIEIEYNADDNLAEISKLIMSLDPNDTVVRIAFSKELDYEGLKKLKQKHTKDKENYSSTCKFLEAHLVSHLPAVSVRSVSADGKEWVDLKKENIQLSKIIGFQCISAKREVTNKDHDKTLSTQTSLIYKKSSENADQKAAVDGFKKKLRDTDDELTGIYDGLFKGVIGKIKKFGGQQEDDTLIKIVSSLQHRELLAGNTTVTYKQNDHDLPEHYNGLGYMNLISMIFEIEVLVSQLKMTPDKIPAPLNLLFIEEPEAHTHPQMQYVFIKNIKALLDESRSIEGGSRLNLQSVISTHSSHIVAESDFDDIKYLQRSGSCSVVAKNLKSLEQQHQGDEKEKQHFKFLKQYLTLNRSEAFFADKLILIEGDTERILLPAMMKQIDQRQAEDDKAIPMISQNVSIIEVGAHSKIFEKLLVFLGIKTLVITDIDSGFTETVTEGGDARQKQRTCKPDDPRAQFTTNSSVTYFHGKKRDDLSYFVNLADKDKPLKQEGGAWQASEDGNLYIAYQTKEGGYHGRSFEDAFFSINREFITSKGHDAFPSLTKKWFDKYNADGDHLQLAENGVKSKAKLAIEILINSVEDGDKNQFSNWVTPSYIKEGLLWLRQS